MYIRASKCPRCGGKIAYEAMGNYGDIHPISVKTGKLLKRERRCHYEHDYNGSLVYCLACRISFNWRMDDEVIFIEVNEEE